MSISDKLVYLSGTKEAIKDAIEQKGVAVPEGTPFRDYANKVAAISGGSDYSAGDGIIIEDGEISTEVPIVGYGPIRSKIFRISVLEVRREGESVNFTGIGFGDLDGPIPTGEAIITSPGSDPSVLLDDTISSWSGPISDAIFTIIFPNVIAVNFLRIRSSGSTQTIRCPRIVKLEISVDGLNFADAGTYDLGTWDGSWAWKSMELEPTIRVPLFIGEAPYDGEPHVRIDEEWRKLVAGDSIEIDTTGTPGEVIISVPEIGDISAALDAINGEVI